MEVCVHCAATAARMQKAERTIGMLQKLIEAQEKELKETDLAFWELAQDVRLDVVQVEVKDDFVSQIFPDEVAQERKVSA